MTASLIVLTGPRPGRCGSAGKDAHSAAGADVPETGGYVVTGADWRAFAVKVKAGAHDPR